MSIKDHKWSDEDIDSANSKGVNCEIQLDIGDGYMYINKSDAKAIAEHFEIDRGTLVNKIKALIEDVDKRHHTYWADDQKGKSMAYGYCAEELQSLINEELTSEDIEK